MIFLKYFIFLFLNIISVGFSLITEDGIFKTCSQFKTIPKLDLKSFSGLWLVSYRSKLNENITTFCDRMHIQYVNEKKIITNTSQFNTDSKQTTQSIEQFYDPNKPGNFKSVLTNNIFLTKFYGILEYQVLDIEYSKYALIYLCESEFFGRKISEAMFLLSRNSNFLGKDLYLKVNKIFKSINYHGEPLLKINHSSSLCQNL